MRYLNSRDVRELTSMAAVIDAVEDAYELLGSGRATDRPRDNVGVEALPGDLKSLQAAAPIGLGGVVYSGFRGSDPDGPTKLSLVFDPETGGIDCLIESDRLSWLRTGATSGVATDYCARADSTTVGLIGSGKQARSQLLAVDAVRDLETVTVYSPTPANRAAFAEEMGERLGLDVRAVADPEDAVRSSDVVCTATTSDEPVFDGDWLERGTHVNAIGAHYPDQREVDSTAVRTSRVVVDSEPRARREEGEVLIPIEEGVLAWDDVTELGDVVTGAAPGRTTDREITLMTSGGLAIEYLAVAAAVNQRAIESGVGLDLPAEADADRPLA